MFLGICLKAFIIVLLVLEEDFYTKIVYRFSLESSQMACWKGSWVMFSTNKNYFNKNHI